MNYENVINWAVRWGVSMDALRELADVTDQVPPPVGQSEQAASNAVRMEASRKGCRLWRNNVGGLYDDTGRFIRYGLANDSKAMNEMIKSSDLIGIRPIRIGPEHSGKLIGQFVAREVKKPNWKFAGTPREHAQLRFLTLVAQMGGDASFAVGEGSL